MEDGIDVEGHPLWVPVPLHLSPDELRAELVGRYAGSLPDEDLDSVADGLVAVSRRLVEDEPTDGSMNLAGWALVAHPDGLEVRAFATLRVVPLEPSADLAAAVDRLLDGQELFQPPQAGTVETRSGPAATVRFRPIVEEDGQTEVHQVSAVLWARPARLALFLLSTYALDLREAEDAGDLLEELAAGVGGL